MTNAEIYKRTFKFTWLRLLVGLIGLAAAGVITIIGYLVTRGASESVNIITTSTCFVVGLIVFGLIVHYLGYMLKAGQIAMITRGITKGELPDDVVAEGKAEVKKRFVTANVYFALQSAIRAITSQITNGLGALTSLAGGNENGVVGAIGSLISMFVQIVLEYINYCCLGWVFRNPDQSAFKSTCDGAVLYFQNWKTLLKNAGKVMAITLAFFIVVGAIFALIGVGILNAIVPEDPAMDEVALTTEDGTALTMRQVAYIGIAVVALILAGLLFSAFVKPYLLVMVMRGYMDSAEGTTIGFDLYDKLCGLSKRFKKLFTKAQEETPGEFAQA